MLASLGLPWEGQEWRETLEWDSGGGDGAVGSMGVTGSLVCSQIVREAWGPSPLPAPPCSPLPPLQWG